MSASPFAAGRPQRRLVHSLAGLIPWLFPLLTLIGLSGILLPSFGWLPALGKESFSLEPWQILWETPALGQMVFTTLFTGFAATILSLLLSFLFLATCWKTRFWTLTERLLSPLLAIPHSALTIGVVFLLSPSGLLSRLLAGPMGWQHPPDLLTVNDPYGFSLILALVLKEAPFLCLMLIAAVSQTPVQRLLLTGQSLGYSAWQCWLKLVWPVLYPKIRLSVLIVLAFSLSVVDVSLIIGPTLPPLFPVQILHWQQDPDLLMALPAAAGALTLMVLTGLSLLLWLSIEKVMVRLSSTWLVNGYRGKSRPFIQVSSRLLPSLSLLLAFLSLLIIVIWSFSWRWRFPDLLPADLSLRVWSRYFDGVYEPLFSTLTIALASTVLSLLLSLVCLEFRTANQSRFNRLHLAFFYLPLLLPQMSLLLGLQTPLVALHLDGQWTTVVFYHLIYVFPYCYLSLADPWQKYDQRYTQAGLLLSGSPVRTFVRVKLPMLLSPLLTAFALGIAVSTALYLPTLMAGAGRYETLTTEAVALSSGGNRRLLSLYAVLQMVVPLVFFSLALLLPRLLQKLQQRRTSQSLPHSEVPS
ncbi:ABC transporter permease [Parendozoicomonas haliclonae]|uniref:Inner membrane ABC transporter permease protein YnjC n=1 Tax=Parendozoicomonas haliclonae TaxID=1960125 RepID=A0A1X7AMU5_9GAMM|nr:hypothetical protein [Parendozoicomonas haliclonae]SMA49394.1 Inner membrane ABC transporter permease protein YnjC [Parendozoicomonas haliclonae]